MSEKQDYIAFIEKQSDVPLFYKPWWLDAVCIDCKWDVVLSRDKSEKIDGVFVYTIKKKYGLLTSMNMPILTPYLGVLFFTNSNVTKPHALYSHQKRILENVENKLPKSHYLHLQLHPKIKNTLGLNWKGFKTKNRYTYIIDLTNSLSEIEKNFKGSLRTDIKKASSNLTIQDDDNPSHFYSVNKKSFDRQNMDMPYGEKLIDNIFKATKANNDLLCLKATDKNDNVHASVLIVYDTQSAYCLATGADPNFRNSGAISLLLWEAIKRSKGRVNNFDFEGGNIQSIEKLFRAFGGNMVNYLSIYRSPNRVLDSIFTLMGKV